MSSPSPVAINSNFTLKVEGSLESHDISFGTTRLITSETSYGARFGDAPGAGVLVAGHIGDVQSATLSGFTNPTPTSFRFAHGIAESYLGGGTATYSFSSPGIHGIGILPQLPTLQAGVLWGVSQDYTLIGIDPTPGAIVLTLTTNQPVTFTKLINEICPKVSFLNVTGCYNCAAGVSIYVSILSTCLDGTVVIKEVGIDKEVEVVTMSMSITRTVSIQKVIITTERKHLDIEMTFQSGPNIDKIHVVATLDEPPDLVGDDGQVIVRNETGSSNNFNDWFSNLNLGAKIGFSIGVGISGLLILGVLILVGYMVINKASLSELRRLIPENKSSKDDITENKESEDLEFSSDESLASFEYN
jgi:hypothetical protein